MEARGGSKEEIAPVETNLTLVQEKKKKKDRNTKTQLKISTIIQNSLLLIIV